MKRRGPACSVCIHPRREEIDALRGETQLRAAKKLGVTKSALDRHRKHAEFATAAVAKGEVSTVPPPPLTPETALDALEKGMARIAQDMARAATEEMPNLIKSWNLLQKAKEDALRKVEITEEQIVASAWWARFKDRLEVALRPYPDAARALMQALTEAA